MGTFMLSALMQALSMCRLPPREEGCTKVDQWAPLLRGMQGVESFLVGRGGGEGGGGDEHGGNNECCLTEVPGASERTGPHPHYRRHLPAPAAGEAAAAAYFEHSAFHAHLTELVHAVGCVVACVEAWAGQRGLSCGGCKRLNLPTLSRSRAPGSCL